MEVQNLKLQKSRHSSRSGVSNTVYYPATCRLPIEGLNSHTRTSISSMDNIDPQGRLNYDKTVCELLIKRTHLTQNAISHHPRFCLAINFKIPFHASKKTLKVFKNGQISRHWGETWQLKEKSLKTRYPKTMEQLNEHSRPLSLFQVADQGQHPTRWDRSGVVVSSLRWMCHPSQPKIPP